MKEDGMLDNFKGKLEIKMLFLDAVAGEAHTMTHAFLNSLKNTLSRNKG